jgi:conjugative transfer signal peptidase TraF
MNSGRFDRFGRHIMSCLTAVGCLLVGVSSAELLPTKMVWNTSVSVPTGLYTIKNRPPVRGDLVLVRLPEHARELAGQRSYLPTDIPALKRVAALDGDIVCRFGRAVSANGETVAIARMNDGFAFIMPLWSGCVKLNDGQVFLLSHHPKSFDGRYFGVTDMAEVMGVAAPLWTVAK